MSGCIMGVALRPAGLKFRGVVACLEVGEDLEPVGDVQVLWEGQPMNSARAANREALRRYWGLYEMRHGFKHPDDPSRRPGDPPPTMSVVSMVEDAPDLR